MAVAAVDNIGLAGAVRKAQLVGVCIVKNRVHLPAGGINLNADRGIQQRFIVDILVQQIMHKLVITCIVCCLIVIKGIDIAVQLVQLSLRMICRISKMRADIADIAHLCAEIIQFPCRIHARQGNLRRLEQCAGVGLVFLKACQTDIANQAAAHKGSQNRRDGQHDHQLHHCKALFEFFVALHHR